MYASPCCEHGVLGAGGTMSAAPGVGGGLPLPVVPSVFTPPGREGGCLNYCPLRLSEETGLAPEVKAGGGAQPGGLSRTFCGSPQVDMFMCT